MSLKIRRGTDAERSAVTFAEGEPVYTTDLKQWWVGDGVTAGGIQVSGVPTSWGDIIGTVTDQTDLVNYIDAEIVAAVTGLWDDRGNFDASVNAYPSSGGSGTAGAILKGDIWTVSVGGTLPTGLVVLPGDTVRALVDTPGNTQANWAIAENNIGYVPENQANKDTDGTLSANSDTKYASQKATKTYADTKQPLDATLTALAGLATGADKFPYSTGTDAFSQAALTALGRTMLALAGPSAIRFYKINADNSISLRTAAEILTDLSIAFGTTTGTYAQGDDSRFTDVRYQKIFAYINTDVTHTGDTTEYVLGCLAMPIMGANDLCRIMTHIGKTGSASTGQWKMYVNTSAQTAGNAFNASGPTAVATFTANVFGWGFARRWVNKNSVSANIIMAAGSSFPGEESTSDTANTTTLNIDTSVQQYIIITGKCNNSGDTVKLHDFQLYWDKI